MSKSKNPLSSMRFRTAVGETLLEVLGAGLPFTEDDIKKLRDDLIQAYRNLRCIQVSPKFEKKRCDIDNIYVDLVIEKKQDTKNTEEKQGSRNTEKESKYMYIQGNGALSHPRKKVKVTSYKQIFLDDGGTKFKRVFMLGKGGLGKTTFCRKVLHAWCNAHEGRAVPQDGYFQDEGVLLMFDLLFYMNLRDVSVETNLTEAILAQFPLADVSSENELGTLLKHTGDKALFILDGLDEMRVKARFIENVVTRKLYPNCCFLVSSRPWKISKMELDNGTEIDLLLKLQGFNNRMAEKFAEKIFENCYEDKKAITQFMIDVFCNKLAKELINIPLLLLFLAHVWHENKRSLPSKLHELYISFLNLMADRMKEKYKKGRKMKFTQGGTRTMLPSKILKTSLVVNFGEDFLLSICEVAYHFLLSSDKENSVVFEDKQLLKTLGVRGKEKLDVALDLGILSVTDSMSHLNRNSSVSFLHETMQEFFTALCFILNPDKLTNFISSLADLNDVQQNENVILLLFGLMPELGNRVLEKINELCSDDWKTLRNKKWYLSLERYSVTEDKDSILHGVSKIYLRCKEEVIGENVLLNASGLSVLITQKTEFDVLAFAAFDFQCIYEFDQNAWNPDFLQNLDLNGTNFKEHKEYFKVDLRVLTGLVYLRLQFLDCELYLPESGSLSVLIMNSISLHNVLAHCDVLAHCTKLERFIIHKTDLNNCRLDLSKMTELTSLVMTSVSMSNRCCDVLCSTIRHCSRLEEFIIHHTDPHDNMQNLSNMTELTDLDMSVARLSRSFCGLLVMTLTHCTKLETLEIHNIDLYDCMLDLSNTTELTVLDMSSVTMSSSCCDVLGRTLRHCIKLKKFIIFDTDLHNCLLDLSKMTELTHLYMSVVTLSSSCCDVFGRTLTHCTKLKTLKIENTNLHECMLDLSNMTELTTLDMSSVKLSSSCCDVLGRTLTHCTKLKSCIIHNTDLHNSLLNLFKMTELTHFYMSSVKLSNICCDVLGRTLTHCTKLKRLMIHNTDLHDCLLDLSNMTELRNLDMLSVTLSSTCCDVLGRTLTHCTKLKTLEICNTDLHSCLLDFSNLTELQTIRLDKTTLSERASEALALSFHDLKAEQKQFKYYHFNMSQSDNGRNQVSLLPSDPYDECCCCTLL